jgi:periplasmic protein TonB
MSPGLPVGLPPLRDDHERLSWTKLRWSACFLLIVGLFGGAVWIALHRMPAVEPAPETPAAAVMIDLAPLPTAAPVPPSEVPPGPQQTVSQPPPITQARPLLPPAPPAPVPDIAIPLPPEPPPRPQPPRQRVIRPSPKRIVNKTPPAPATTAPSQTEATPAPVQAAPAPGAASAAPSTAVPTWQGLLLSRLERFKRYPQDAQFRRQQGVAYLRFSMDRHGKVLSASIAKSSGYDALDQETLALIYRAEPLPAPPFEMLGDPVELTVPVQFFLQGAMIDGLRRLRPHNGVGISGRSSIEAA